MNEKELKNPESSWAQVLKDVFSLSLGIGPGPYLRGKSVLF